MKAAEKLAEQIKRDIEHDCFDLGEYFPDSPNITGVRAGRPRDFQSLWDRCYKQMELSAASKRKYQSAMDTFWLPLWRERDFRSIFADEVKQAVAGIQWGSIVHRNNCLTPLRKMFAMAVRSRWIPLDPMQHVEFIKRQQAQPDPLSPDEMNRVLAEIKNTLGDHWEIHFGFRFFTGMRPGEVFAMLPGDVDWSTDTVSVTKNQNQDGLRMLTKTSEARDVEMNDYSREYLKRALGLMRDGQETIFAFESGKRIPQGNIPREIWNDALRAAKIKHRSSYNTRHTYITMNIMAGANIYWLAKQCGTSVRMIEKTYSKWIRAVARDRESSKLGRYLNEITMP